MAIVEEIRRVETFKFQLTELRKSSREVSRLGDAFSCLTDETPPSEVAAVYRALLLLMGSSANDVKVSGLCYVTEQRNSSVSQTLASVRIHQQFFRTFFVLLFRFFSILAAFECSTTSDWLNNKV